MRIDFSAAGEVSLAISDQLDEISVYPTRRLMKGVGMSFNGIDLTEEAVGFGVPVVKHGLVTYFPGAMELVNRSGESAPAFTAVYSINLVERVMQNGRILEDEPLLYSTKNLMAALIRNFPLLRKPLTVLSTRMRSRYRWQTTYIPAKMEYIVAATFFYHRMTNSLEVRVDLSGVEPHPYTEAVMMNEQGGTAFDLYSDSSGLQLTGSQIGAWDEINAARATFASSTHGITFSVGRVAGARLFRGRELIDQRLAWAGFGYSVPPGLKSFNYSISLGKSS